MPAMLLFELSRNGDEIEILRARFRCRQAGIRIEAVDAVIVAADRSHEAIQTSALLAQGVVLCLEQEGGPEFPQNAAAAFYDPHFGAFGIDFQDVQPLEKPFGCNAVQASEWDRF